MNISEKRSRNRKAFRYMDFLGSNETYFWKSKYWTLSNFFDPGFKELSISSQSWRIPKNFIALEKAYQIRWIEW